MPNGNDKPGRGRIEVRDLRVVFGGAADAVEAVRGLSFTVEPGEFVCLLGTSGCGKSTILNTLAGFVAPTEGEVSLDGEPLSSSPVTTMPVSNTTTPRSSSICERM